MNRIWLPDSSVLIVLAKAGLLDLLEAPDRTVCITSTVAAEIRHGERSDPARLALKGGFGQVLSINYIPMAVRKHGLLDRGEQTVLAAALKLRGALPILDDARARRAATALGLTFTGTIGVLVEAKSLGRITSLKEALVAVVTAGLYIPADVCRQVVEDRGEQW